MVIHLSRNEYTDGGEPRRIWEGPCVYTNVYVEIWDVENCVFTL